MAGQLAPVCKAGKLNAPREPGDCTEPLGALGMRVMRRLMLIVIVLLAPTAVFAAMVMADREFGGPAREYGYVVKVDLPPAGGDGGLPQIDGPMDASRPLVVIDAGHGGKDPGAGTGGIKEKAVTLALALALRDELIKQGGVRVALTRSDDTYVLLDERPAIARRLGQSYECSEGQATPNSGGSLDRRRCVVPLRTSPNSARNQLSGQRPIRTHDVEPIPDQSWRAIGSRSGNWKGF